MDAIARFVDRLPALPSTDRLTNPYAGPDGEIRAANLRLYLSRMQARRPTALLLGEAPGHRGCVRTGVAFTSEAILLADDGPFGLFGASAGFRSAGPAAPTTEATATAVWAALAALERPPLLWNVLPLHPHRPGDPSTNRTPSRAEVRLGQPLVRHLLELFTVGRVVAIGSMAAAALAEWGMAADRVRHPSHGGQRLFAAQMAALFAPGQGWSEVK